MKQDQSIKTLLEDIHFALTKDRILVGKKWKCRLLSPTNYEHLIPKLEKEIKKLEQESNK